MDMSVNSLNQVNSDSNAISGSQDIGKLYNVLGEMARSESCNNSKGQVVTGLDVMASEPKNVGSNAYAYPEMCELNTEQNTSDQKQYYGSSYHSFEEEYSAQAGLSGNYGYFSGTLDVKYTEASRSVEENQYLTLTVLAQYGMLTLKNQDELPLDESFSADLNNPDMDAETFFKEWGTHLVVGVKIGGQSSYMCYASKTSFETETDFTVAAEANYGYITGYAGYNQSTKEYNENVEGSNSLYVLGGDISLPNQGKWDEWIASVQENPQWMAFTPAGLKPVWELCDDTDRGQYLSDQFKLLYTPSCSDQTREVHGSSDAMQVGYVTTDSDLFITGFGANVNHNGHCNRCAIQYESATTNERHWVVDGDVSTFNQKNYERIGEVPEGCALTGIGLREKNDNLKNMKFYYQVVNDGESDNNGSALDYQVNEMYFGDPLDSYEVEYQPSAHNTRVLQGIEVSAGGGKFKTLNLYTAYFALPIESDD